ncbi:hypothetical protein FQZ97_900240 [compost metagenome]
MRQMRASGEYTSGLGNEVRIDIVFAKRHVGAVFAIEDEREMFLITDAKDHQRCQALRIGDDTARIHTFTRKFTQQKAPHMLVTDAGYECRFEAQSSSASRDIGGGATDIFVEG